MKLPHTASCSSGVDDKITVEEMTGGGGEIMLVGSPARGDRYTIFLSAADARRLAKAVKKAAKKAEADQ